MFAISMRPFNKVFYCIECFVMLRSRKHSTLITERIRQKQRMQLREQQMGVKYGSAEKVTVVGSKAVISEESVSSEEAEKIASAKPTTKRKKAVVTDKDFRRTDEDHIPGD